MVPICSHFCQFNYNTSVNIDDVRLLGVKLFELRCA